MTACFVCAKHADPAVVGGALIDDDLVYAGHVLPPDLTGVYLGYLMVEPKRHVAGLGELTDDEASAIGVAVNRIAGLLRTSEGAEHVYSFVLGDAVPHVHVHVVPRYPGAPREFWGPRVDQWPDAPRGGSAEIGALMDRLRVALGED